MSSETNARADMDARAANAIASGMRALGHELENVVASAHKVIDAAEAAGLDPARASAKLNASAGFSFNSRELEKLLAGDAPELSDAELDRLGVMLRTQQSNKERLSRQEKLRAERTHEGIAYLVANSSKLTGWADVVMAWGDNRAKDASDLLKMWQAEKERRKAEAEAARPITLEELEARLAMLEASAG